MNLGESIKIGSLELKNRTIFAPVKTGYGVASGEVTERHLSFYRERAAGGVGAIIPEPLALDASLRELPVQIGSYAANLPELVDVVHREGSKAIAHLNHPGRMANPKIPNTRLVAPSAIPCMKMPIPVALDKDGIKEEIAVWSNAALRAKDAGFDAIELQFGHGYLVQQFFSPITNKRDDDYGGTRERRIMFALETLKAVRNAVGDNFPIIVRLSADEKVEGGYGLDAGIYFAEMIAKNGADALHITAGSICDSPPWYFQHMALPMGKTWEMAQAIKNRVSIPVIAVGRIREPNDAMRILNDGMADIVALGRPLVADPEWVNKALTDKTIRKCSACLDGCLFSVKSGKGLRCTVNPWVGNESKTLPNLTGRHYVIVGGGPAGMTAAELLREANAKVTLFEKNKLGGYFRLASIPPTKDTLETAVEYLAKRMDELKVDLRFEEATLDKIAALSPDGVFLSTGAEPIIPPISGIDKEFVVSGVDILDKQIVKSPAIIIGGGMVGMEVAELLASQGAKVTVVELLSDIARDMEPITRALMMKRISNMPIEILTEHKVVEIGDKNVVIESKNGDKSTRQAELVAVVVGMKPYDILSEQLGNAEFPYWKIGDANTIGKAVDAVRSALKTVISI